MRIHVCAILLALFAGSCAAYDPASGDFSKASSGHVRAATWNVNRRFVSEPAADESFRRLISAMNPDIICFEEIAAGVTFDAIRARLDSILPIAEGTSWSVHLGISDGFERNALAARLPESMRITDTSPTSELRGVTGALIDLPASQYGCRVYVMGVHLKCCSGTTETQRRQRHCDALAKWFGDLRTPGGDADLPADTPVVVAGDFNFVDPDPQQPEVTLRTGDIQDNETFGRDARGDWDNTDIWDAAPCDPFTSRSQTWPSGTANPASRLDRMYFTDSVTSTPVCFVLNTKTMSPAQLAAANLQSADSETASDHLPVVSDFIVPVVAVEVSKLEIE